MHPGQNLQGSRLKVNFTEMAIGWRNVWFCVAFRPNRRALRRNRFCCGISRDHRQTKNYVPMMVSASFYCICFPCNVFFRRVALRRWGFRNCQTISTPFRILLATEALLFPRLTADRTLAFRWSHVLSYVDLIDVRNLDCCEKSYEGMVQHVFMSHCNGRLQYASNLFCLAPKKFSHWFPLLGLFPNDGYDVTVKRSPFEWNPETKLILPVWTFMVSYFFVIAVCITVDVFCLKFAEKVCRIRSSPVSACTIFLRENSVRNITWNPRNPWFCLRELW